MGTLFLATALWWYTWRRKSALYKYSLVTLFTESAVGKDALLRAQQWRRRYLFFRATFFFLLVIAAAGPRIPDERSRAEVQGRAIMLALDMSGSMELFDDLTTKRSRFSVAKEEALKFIEKRTNDLLGIVLFGARAVTRCPLTADRELVARAVREAELGSIDPDGTVLSIALSLCVNRLATAKAQSKVVVLLTDGAPSQDDLDPKVVLELAKQAGVKIYTIGIGSSAGGYGEHPLGGIVQFETPLNEMLLNRLATETGGKYFRAHSQAELAEIYNAIDALETTAHEAPRYHYYHELYRYPLVIALMLLALELLLRSRWVVLL